MPVGRSDRSGMPRCEEPTRLQTFVARKVAAEKPIPQALSFTQPRQVGKNLPRILVPGIIDR